MCTRRILECLVLSSAIDLTVRVSAYAAVGFLNIHSSILTTPCDVPSYSPVVMDRCRSECIDNNFQLVQVRQNTCCKRLTV